MSEFVSGEALTEVFHYQATRHFAGKLEDIKKSDPPGYRRLLKVIDRLLLHPGEADGMMQGEHRGKLKKYVGRAEYRLIYHWCEACRKTNQHLSHACELCGQIPDRSVVFFDVFHKSEYRKLDY